MAEQVIYLVKIWKHLPSGVAVSVTCEGQNAVMVSS